jgi:hypothetical protein
MSGQLKLSKLFYVDPKLLPTPIIRKHATTYYRQHLKADIFSSGFDSKRPIIVRLRTNTDPARIADGNHRLAIALELKLDHVPVRFEYQKQ